MLRFAESARLRPAAQRRSRDPQDHVAAVATGGCAAPGGKARRRARGSRGDRAGRPHGRPARSPLLKRLGRRAGRRLSRVRYEHRRGSDATSDRVVRLHHRHISDPGAAQVGRTRRRLQRRRVRQAASHLAHAQPQRTVGVDRQLHIQPLVTRRIPVEVPAARARVVPARVAAAELHTVRGRLEPPDI